MSGVQKTKIYELYLGLVKKYGSPKDFWQKWCKAEKTIQDKEEIALGAILTQRVNWLNVEKALANLKQERILSLTGIYGLGRRDMARLEQLIKPAGFYHQKATRLFSFCQFIIGKHNGLEKFFKQSTKNCRQQLLAIAGIGPETADDILLYAGSKQVFVIDEYTRRFAKKHNLSDNLLYRELQTLFQDNLPKDVRTYRNFHAMLVLEGRNTGWDLVFKTRVP